ncbi:NRDE family protein [Stutzerimonas stutzeri]
MCLIVFAWRPQHSVPLIVAANRDEFYDRPSLPLGHWQDAPGVVGGIDLQGGGTWMAVTERGRFAALTNIRDPSAPTGSRSRGELPAQYLRGDLSPEAYLIEVSGFLEHYSGFNLLVGDRDELWYLNSREATPRKLAAGVYGLSNAALDSPWPKLRRARAALQGCLDTASCETLLQLLSDPSTAEDEELPDTGVSQELERLLSSVFIASADYGTRASTVIIRHADGSTEVVERSFDAKGPAGETRIVLPPFRD